MTVRELNPSKKLLIIGCGGHSKVITDIAKSLGHESICYLDTKEQNQVFLNNYVYNEINENYNENFIVAIGDNYSRESIYRDFKLKHPQANAATLIHPSSYLSSESAFGEGTVIMPNCVINSHCSLGSGVIINTSSTIEHDCKIKDFSSLATAVNIGGNVTIGFRSAICIGGIVKHGLKIGNDVVVGASSLVLKDIKDNSLCYGIPAKLIRERKPGDLYL